MPYPDRLTRFNINAQIGPGEIMVHTVWLQRDGAPTSGPKSLQSLTDKVRDKWAQLLTGGGSVTNPIVGYYADSTVFTSVSGYAVDGLGKATEQAESTFAANVRGNSGSRLPTQLALCVSLLTNSPGRSGRGRLYLGGLSTAPMGNDGRLTLVARGNTVRAMAGFYRDLRDDSGIPDDYRPVVVSPTTTKASKITAVSVGDVFDTMRSRRNALVEAKERAVVDP